MLMVSILNQKMHILPIAWKCLGYMFDLSMIQSQAKTKDLKAAHLHAIFKVVLATFVYSQKEGALDNICLTFGKVSTSSHFCFFIGNMQGGDKITCMSASYSNTMKRMCHKCNVGVSDSGDSFLKCQCTSMVNVMTEAVLDDLVWSLTNLSRQCFALSGVEPLMPCLLWKDGISTRLSKLTAQYKVGIMFTIVIMSLQDEEKCFLKKH
jgi:hypothetical protein